MEFNYFVRANDYAYYDLYLNRTFPPFKKLRLVARFLLPGLCILLGVYDAVEYVIPELSQEPDPLYIILVNLDWFLIYTGIFYGLPLLWILAYPAVGKWGVFNYSKMSTKYGLNGQFIGRRTLCLLEESIREAGELLTVEAPYDRITEIVRTDKALYLRHNRSLLFLVPLDIFSDESERNVFLKMIQDRTGQGLKEGPA